MDSKERRNIQERIALPDELTRTPTLKLAKQGVIEMAKSKKFCRIVFLVALACALGSLLAGCSQNEDANKKQEPVLSAEGITVDGIYVDDSYVDSESPSLKMVYLFYTATATDKNLSVDSKYTNMTIGENKYESEFYSSEATVKGKTSYYYSKSLKDIYVGEPSCKILATFKVPEADLSSGSAVSLKDSDIPNMEQLSFTTDDMKHAQSGDEIARQVDPEKYAEELAKYDPADEETCASVQDAIIGYEYYSYYGRLCTKVYFSNAESFKLEKPISKKGTYQILKGYIALTYDGNEQPSAYVPWSWKDNGQISLDLTAGFGLSD